MKLKQTTAVLAVLALLACPLLATANSKGNPSGNPQGSSWGSPNGGSSAGLSSVAAANPMSSSMGSSSNGPRDGLSGNPQGSSWGSPNGGSSAGPSNGRSGNPKGGAKTRGSCSPKQLAVFSDSLSDDGNYYNLTGGVYPPSPPYFDGRFCNGPVWPEYTANISHLHLRDFAVAGATACESNQAIIAQLGFPGLPSPISIETQVDDYVNSTINTGLRAPCRRVTVIEGGDNDFGAVFAAYLANPNQTLNETFFASAAEGIAACFFSSVYKLLDAGELNLIIATPLDPTNAPFTIAQGPAAVNFSSALAAAYNDALLQGVQQLQAQLSPRQQGSRHRGGRGTQRGDCCTTRRTSIQLVDLHSTFDSLFEDPAALQAATGATDVATPCVVAAANGTILSVCSDPDTHFYWDDLHPNTNVYKYVGQLFSDAVSNL